MAVGLTMRWLFRLLPGWLSRRGRRSAYGPHRLGIAGERAAERHLQAGGYRILAKNVRLGRGEIDLIAFSPDGAWLVFVEVKSGEVGALRSGRGVSRPEQHLTERKKRKLRWLARAAMRSGKLPNLPARIDLVAVELADEKVTALRHYERVS